MEFIERGLIWMLLIIIALLGGMLYYEHREYGRRPVATTESVRFDGPAVQKQLVDSGIAKRMLEDVKFRNGSLLPPINFGLEKCSFWLEKTGETIILVIERPDMNSRNLEIIPQVQQLFQVKEGVGFGASDEPLTSEQFALIEKIVGSK